MSPVKGKQVKNDPINKLVHFRANKETRERLDYVSEKTGMSKSEVIRKVIDDQYNKLQEENG